MTDLPVRALIIKSAASIDSELTKILQAAGDIAVVGEMASIRGAAERVASLEPDVVILECALGEVGCVDVVREIMADAPRPILLLCNESRPGAEAALAAGALDVLPIPPRWDDPSSAALRARLRLLRGVTVVRHPRRNATESNESNEVEPVVAIAASAGGPAALAELLPALAGLEAPVLVVQHLHPDFASGFVSWMKRVSALPLEEAIDGVRVCPGAVYVAPAGRHLKLNERRRIVLDDEPDVLHRPSADELFKSVARFGGAGIGLVLTGMGADGTAGLLAMRDQGAITIVQDEETSAVYGMPSAALRAGAAQLSAPLGELPVLIHDAVRKRNRAKRS
jgi:two-component system, chemotaxis family, protein-glutamate methylesterase/glutaminase